jgi:hypothetical protein
VTTRSRTTDQSSTRSTGCSGDCRELAGRAAIGLEQDRLRVVRESGAVNIQPAVALFPAAKQRRQILLITHNPNLVVNTDSEQVIIARATRRQDGPPAFSYVAGALEHMAHTDDGIHRQVCRILEGGERAFHEREQRYALPDL